MIFGLTGLGLLALAACMLVFRDQTDAVLEVIVTRRRRTYGPVDFAFYVALVAGLGSGLSALAGWAAWSIPNSERRLDQHLAGQVDDLAQRNTRTLD